MIGLHSIIGVKAEKLPEPLVNYRDLLPLGLLYLIVSTKSPFKPFKQDNFQIDELSSLISL